MKLGKWLVAGAVMVVMLSVGPATAKNGLYVGASFGQTTLKINDFDLDLESFDYNADDTSYKIIVGWRFFQVLVERSRSPVWTSWPELWPPR